MQLFTAEGLSSTSPVWALPGKATTKHQKTDLGSTQLTFLYSTACPVDTQLRPPPYKLCFLALGEEGNIEGLGKVLAQKVGRAGLQSHAILCHALNRVGFNGSCKSLILRLPT
eukprot:3328432-Amphidinium_carterae.1